VVVGGDGWAERALPPSVARVASLAAAVDAVRATLHV
jgi:hypothetical protein